MYKQQQNDVEHLSEENFQWLPFDELTIYNGYLVSEIDTRYFVASSILQTINDLMPTMIMAEVLKTSGNLIGLMTAISIMGMTPSLMDAMICLSIIDIITGSFHVYDYYIKQLKDDDYEKYYKSSDEESLFYYTKINKIFIRKLILTTYFFSLLNLNENVDKMKIFEIIFNFISMFSNYYVATPTFYMKVSWGPCFQFIGLKSIIQNMYTTTSNFMQFSSPISYYDDKIHLILTKCIYDYKIYTSDKYSLLYYSVAARLYYNTNINNFTSYIELYSDLKDNVSFDLFILKDKNENVMNLKLDDFILGLRNSDKDINNIKDEHIVNCIKLFNKFKELSKIVCEESYKILYAYYGYGSPLTNTNIRQHKKYSDNDIDIEGINKEILILNSSNIFGDNYIAHDVFSIESRGSDIGFKILNLMVGDFPLLKQVHMQSYFSSIKYGISDVSIQYLQGLYHLLDNKENVLNFCINNYIYLLNFNINDNLLYNDLISEFNLSYVLNINQYSESDKRKYKEQKKFIEKLVSFLLGINPALKYNYTQQYI